jgi:hypothetical protein
MKRSLSIAALAFAVSALIVPVTSFAATTPSSSTATNQSFQISPPTANFASGPGKTVTGTIKVTNLSDAALSLNVGKENFVAKGEEGEIELVDNADPLYSLAPWFNLGVATLQVPARQTKSFTYTVAIPAGAEPGGRYGSITFNTVAPKLPSGQSGAAVQQQIAAVVFMRINGQANEKLSIASFASDKTFYEYGPVKFTARVKNDGSVHEKPTGTITVKNTLGMKVATIPLDEHFVIPGAVRRLHNQWPASGKHPFLIGRYSAHLEATYASGKTLSADTSFTVIPYKLVLGILIVLLLLLIILIRGRQRFARAARILAGRE